MHETILSPSVTDLEVCLMFFLFVSNSKTTFFSRSVKKDLKKINKRSVVLDLSGDFVVFNERQHHFCFFTLRKQTHTHREFVSFHSNCFASQRKAISLREIIIYVMCIERCGK